jgi:Tol biopolymer transport system component
LAESFDRLKTALADRYRLERELGQGGMATVYLAEDLRHNRKVALKVLKPELAAVIGAERFVIEIKTTAALQHPHILPLFDSGTADGFLYYVMPFIDGETLRSKLDRETQLGVTEAVKITVAVADALDYAHRQGVIHRDIKPENILLHDGRPMVADFGIALALSAAAGGRMTETGMSLGTPHYMSPEQATAEKEITARSDIYSLGSVLYEMLTGNPPHVGASAQQIIMRIVTEDAAPVTKLRRSVPPNVAAAVMKSLEKLPADRFTNAAEFGAALTDPGYSSRVTAMTASTRDMAPRRNGLTVAGWALWVVTLVGGLWLLSRAGSGAQPVRRYAIEMTGAETIATNTMQVLALSADGNRIGFVGGGAGGSRQIWIRDRDQLHARPLAGTEGAAALSWSPDGNQVAFVVSPGVLKVAPVDGAAPTVVADSLISNGGTAWGRDGLIYSAGGFRNTGVGLISVPATGGLPTALTTLDSTRHEFAHLSPAVLPNNRGLVFSVWYGPTHPNETEVAVLEFKTGSYRILQRGLRARYLRTGHLLIARADGSLVAVPFDQNKLAITGAPIPVVTGVAEQAGYVVDYDVSDAGTLMYLAGQPGNVKEMVQPVWVNRQGVAAPVDSGWSFNRPYNGGMSLSPDGTRLAVAIAGEPTSDIWIKQLNHGPLSRLTFEEFLKYRPVWSPDGRTVTYIADPGNSNAALYRKRADGSGDAERLLGSDKSLAEALWSRDGQWLVVRTTLPSRDIQAFRPGVDTTLTPIVATPRFEERAPTLSPDGRWIAYQSDETGKSEIYVRPFPRAGEGRWQVSTAGGEEPLWSHAGAEIFFRAASGEMMTVPVVTNPTFSASVPAPLFQARPYARSLSYRAYDVSPDDRRFVMLRPAADSVPTPARQLVVVDNWIEELKSKLRNK